MPFTFAHPAVVLPFGWRKQFSMTALMIGSMVPDFEYFIFLTDKSQHGHTWPGMFYFDLPIAFVLAFLYHNFIKNQLTSNLPAFISKRILGFNSFNWNDHVKRNFFAVFISFLLGISSHLLWDMFTHYDVGMFKQFPWMLYPIRFSATYVIGLFVLLWYISSLVGLIIVCYALLKLPKNSNSSTKISPAFWALTIGLSIVVILIRTLLNPVYKNLPEVLIVLLGSLMWGIVLCTAFRKLFVNAKQTS